MRREIMASPKKAAMMGLLAVVALYFWAPLIAGWAKRGEPQGDKTVASTGTKMSEVAAIADAIGVPPVKPAQPRLTWQQQLARIETDPVAKVGRFSQGMRDPFAVVKPVVEQVEVVQERPKPKVAVTPQALGLALSGTIIGAGRKVARLSGKNFTEGQTIEVAKDGQAYRFTLTTVDERRIVLTREGESFELAIPPPSRSNRIDLTRLEN